MTRTRFGLALGAALGALLFSLPAAAEGPEFKVDHLIPAELGGADTIDNLWPQSLSTLPYNAQRKDLLTQRLLARIAAGEMTITQAQKEISEDWISCFVDHFGMVYLR